MRFDFNRMTASLVRKIYVFSVFYIFLQFTISYIFCVLGRAPAGSTGAVFASAPYRRLVDPRERLLGYVDFRIAILDRPIPEFACLLGTLVQEVYRSHPALLSACDAGMSGHIDELVADAVEAKALHAPDADWTPESVGFVVQAVLQGSFIFAKAKNGAEVARDNLAHLRRYLEMLFPPAVKKE